MINHIIANENFPLIVQLKFIFEGLWWKNLETFGVFGYFFKLFKLSTQGVKITISDFLSRIFILNSKTSCRLSISWYLTFKVHFRCYRPAHFLHLGSQRWKVIPKSLRVAKRALRGPKSENQLYLNNYDSIRPKNWQMLRTNWYNCFRKDFMGYRVRKNWLLGAKGAKLGVE